MSKIGKNSVFRIKCIIAILATLSVWMLMRLPSVAEVENNLWGLENEYNSLDDFDYRSRAIELWKQGERETALTYLEIIIDQNLDDTPAAQELYNDYCRQLQDRSSALGRLEAFGYSFVTGNVNSFEELAGASLADFFIYGDIRDLTKELALSDDPNGFIITLSSIGLLTTLFPPADPAASMLKTAYKSGAVSAEFAGQMQKILNPVAKAGKQAPIAEVKVAIEHLKPVWELGKNSKTWHQFTIFLKHCKDIKQIRFINKILENAGNGRKLNAVLAPIAKMPERSAAALGFIKAYGQKGMDGLYTVLRKGPDGVQFLIKNPKLYTRLMKNSVKSGNLIVNKVNDRWSDSVLKYGKVMEFIRYAICFILIAFVLKLFIGNRKPQKSSNESTGEVLVKKPRTRNIIVSLAIPLVLIFTLVNFSSPSQLPFDTAGMSVKTPVQTTQQSTMPILSIFILAVFCAFQVWAFIRTKSEIERISQKKDKDLKLDLLNNAEFYFDLPVYIGLAGTVFSFIMLTFDPSGSRVLAYTTTVSGILLSIFLRGFWLIPLKRKLLEAGHE